MMPYLAPNVSLGGAKLWVSIAVSVQGQAW